MNLTAEFDEQLNTSERKLINVARQFATDHLSSCNSTAHTQRSHQELLALASQSGLAGMEVPEDAGGAEASFSTRMRVCEELARSDAAFAFSLVNHHNVISRIALSGQSSFSQKWVRPMLRGDHFGCTAMSEPQSGSDFSAMRSTATQTGTGWKLNGEKAWIANAAFADTFLVYAQTDPNAGIKGIAGFVVLASDQGFVREPAYSLTGIEAMGVGGFKLENCVIPHDRVLYPPGAGFMSAMQGVNRARIHVAAINTGMLEASLKAAIGYGHTRQAFGQSLLDFQGLRWSLANVATQLQAMRLMTYSGARAIDTGADAQNAAAMAKKYANDQAASAIATCMQAMGAAGLLPHYPLTRHLSCARALCYTDGTPEMMNERISHLLRKQYIEAA